MKRTEVLRYRDGEWVVHGGEWWEITEFTNWREAMDYADKRARTVEIELPRDAHHNTGHMRTTPSTDGLLIEFRIEGKWEPIRVAKHELKPLALALLTQHYTKEKE